MYKLLYWLNRIFFRVLFIILTLFAIWTGLDIGGCIGKGVVGLDHKSTQSRQAASGVR